MASDVAFFVHHVRTRPFRPARGKVLINGDRRGHARVPTPPNSSSCTTGGSGPHTPLDGLVVVLYDGPGLTPVHGQTRFIASRRSTPA